MAEIVEAARAATPAAEATRIVLRPPSADGGDEFTVKRTGEGWRVRGEKPERWVRQTDFSNDEAVGFLADRLNRLGVETRLVELGAEEGDAVLIGDPDNAVVFDFQPGIDAGAEILGRRGEDQRFDDSRPAARRRRAIDEAMDDRGEGETRADVARRLDTSRRPTDPTSYEIGSADDPDWAADPAERSGGGRPGRVSTRTEVTAAKRVVVKVGSSSLTTAAGGIDPGAGPRPGRRARQLRAGRRRGRAGLLRRDRRRPRPARAAQAPPGAARPSRPRPRWARGCWCTATPRSWPGTA